MWQMACSNGSVAHSRFSRGGRFHQHTCSHASSRNSFDDVSRECHYADGRSNPARRLRELRVATEFTHEEIAQMIGSSRETVTRLLSDMKRKDLIRLEGATLVIANRIALQAIAA